jgi:hypothetical protein
VFWRLRDFDGRAEEVLVKSLHTWTGVAFDVVVFCSFFSLKGFFSLVKFICTRVVLLMKCIT